MKRSGGHLSPLQCNFVALSSSLVKPPPKTIRTNCTKFWKSSQISSDEKEPIFKIWKKRHFLTFWKSQVLNKLIFDHTISGFFQCLDLLANLPPEMPIQRRSQPVTRTSVRFDNYAWRWQTVIVLASVPYRLLTAVVLSLIIRTHFSFSGCSKGRRWQSSKSH